MLPDIDYSQFQVPRRTRASDCCTCRWCWVGRLKGQQFTTYCKSVRNQRGRPRTSPLNNLLFNIFSMATSLNSILEEVSRSPDPQPLH